VNEVIRGQLVEGPGGCLAWSLSIVESIDSSKRICYDLVSRVYSLALLRLPSGLVSSSKSEVYLLRVFQAFLPS